MVRITEDLIRKRAEHNECEICSLEEISLHQQGVERIEHLDRWCRDLKILYLQNNVIPKIENVGRLKKLEYLNLALNNVERIENLEGCESLKKLDLTVNFVGELTSVEHLQQNQFLQELYLTGNPCTDYDGYRQYVVTTLPQLKTLDGKIIQKTERILARQEYEEVRKRIIEQQKEYIQKRLKEKEESERKAEAQEARTGAQPGFDGRWYTDINTHQSDSNTKDGEGGKEEKEDEEFWKQQVGYTPESRLEIQKKIEEQNRKKEGVEDDQPKRQRNLFAEDGRPYNVNEAKVDFNLTENEDDNTLQLDVAVFRYMDISLMDVDVQPTYVRVTIKGKILQLHLPEEVRPDSCKAVRSQTTGNLLITMPKATQVVKPLKVKQDKDKKTSKPAEPPTGKARQAFERLEVDPSKSKGVDFAAITAEKHRPAAQPFGTVTSRPVERPNSEDFVDNLDVPPLV
ncbi:dynein axonemal assembly factor 11-like [Branchiostoma floridae x Branchiostoma japonicum]